MYPGVISQEFHGLFIQRSAVGADAGDDALGMNVVHQGEEVTLEERLSAAKVDFKDLEISQLVYNRLALFQAEFIREFGFTA
jgi:hypothetical protein